MPTDLVTSITIRDVRLVFPGETIRRGSLRISDGKIERIDPARVADDEATVDGEGRLLTPGMIDVHTHGMHQFNYQSGVPATFALAGLLGQFGTTTVFPTLVPRGDPRLLENLAELVAALPRASGARFPGLHLEGPFVKLAGAGCATWDGDLVKLEEMIAACHGRLAIMSVSPDTKNVLPLIERLRAAGVIVFMTHTHASAEQTQAAIDAGASHATHFYDVFPVPEVTEPGVRPVGAVEAILANRHVSVDFICDGIHVHPMAIRAALAAKGWEGVCLITDSNTGAGLPPGSYDTPLGYRVRIRPGDAARREEDNALAGSALTMDQGMRNLFSWLDLPAEQIWAMSTLNPARVMGLKNKGRLMVGADADLVLWDDELRPVKTWVGGELVYERKTA